MSNPIGKVLYLSATYEGSVHDKKICDEEPFESGLLNSKFH